MWVCSQRRESDEKWSFLIKVAELYYRDGLSQQEIAKKLHTSRTSISRALIQARNEGYVQIRIQYPEQSDLGLERELEEKYGLTEALIAVPAYDQSSDQEVAFQAVDYILRVLKKNMVLGMTWGRAMHGFVEQLSKDERLRSMSFQNVKVVPFLGTRSDSVRFVGCNDIFEYTCNESGEFIALCKL